MAGIRLEDPDDEAQLIRRLSAFCARRRTSATVYFDSGPTGSPRTLRQGAVTARFVSRATSADAAILRHLSRLGREAPNWIVVTSDGAVAADARRHGARLESSESFAQQLSESALAPGRAEKPEAVPSPEEIARWEDAFRKPRSPDR